MLSSISISKAAGLAVPAPVAHQGDPQERAGKSLGVTVRPKRGKSLGGRCYVSEAPISDVRESRVVVSAKRREDVKTRLIILIGLPASGKSTLAGKIVSRYPQCKLISTDAIRAQLFGDEGIQGPWLQVWQEVQQQFHQAVSQTSLAIYDATNAQRRRRKELIYLARQTGFSYITGLWLDKSLELCLERNKLRKRQVPEEVIMKMSRQLTDVLPSCEEGFDRLQRITR